VRCAPYDRGRGPGLLPLDRGSPDGERDPWGALVSDGPVGDLPAAVPPPRGAERLVDAAVAGELLGVPRSWVLAQARAGRTTASAARPCRDALAHAPWRGCSRRSRFARMVAIRLTGAARRRACA
jgi:hypothetical protein